MTATGTEWEDLKKQARMLENEIDAKNNHHHHIDTLLSSTNSTISSNSDRMCETISIEIEKLLEKLSDVNKRMSDTVSSLSGPNLGVTLTLQRHCEILQDHRREYERTKTNIRNFKNRENLLMINSSGIKEPTINGIGQSTTGTASGGLSSRRQDNLFKEHSYIDNSIRLMDVNFEIALKTKTNLLDQRKHMIAIKQKMSISYGNRLLSCPKRNAFVCQSSLLEEDNEIYIDDNNEMLLYPNATISVLTTYLAIEKFLIETNLSFCNQKKLFELILTLIPNENNLSLNKYLKWLIGRLQQSDEITNQTQPNEKLDSLENIVLRLAGSVDEIKHNLVRKQETTDEINKAIIPDPITNMRRKKQNCTLEIERTECMDNLPKDSSVIIPTETTSADIKETTTFNGRNMIKHLRPNMTITSFTRQVCCDIFTKNEILDRLHIEDNERTIFLRHCIRTAWNLSNVQFNSVWNRIRTALMQLRRDVLAGKCMSKQKYNGDNGEIAEEDEEHEEDEQLNSNNSFFILNCPSEDNDSDYDERVYSNDDNELVLQQQISIKNEKY
ncbi:unnamed protein product [Didymodactylos carnosus]|uniref:Golgi SNAP receptor complex member 1 n=1 Tax=Didymodactylos carnosus TaxID=1234261 RepID=A0A814GM43_9BILA|nr:unnamed protein product [Didymodactylos carnosus]CAF3769788.1 unnamed protein product [Didymodactylos carnosus]